MLLARRKFIESGLLFSASAFLVWGNTTSVFARTFVDDRQLSDDVLNNSLYRFTRETFEPYVGGYFEAPGARGEMVPLKLIKVDSYTPNPQTKLSPRSAAATESFTLLFSAEAPLPQSQSIHPIKHGALGEVSLFLTRRDGPSEIFYEAVFNHLR